MHMHTHTHTHAHTHAHTHTHTHTQSHAKGFPGGASGKEPVCQSLAQMVKNLPAMRETWVQSLGWDNPLEVGMATHSSILA